jgi:hypothetical protein
MVSTLPERLERHASDLRGGPVSLGELAELQGPALPGTLLVLVSAPCALPIPGIGNVLGATLVLMGLAMWRGNDWTRLPARLAQFQLSATAARRLLRLLAQVHRLAARHARQRLSALAVLRRRTWLAPKVALMGLVIFLPLPFGNVLPAISVTVLGVGVAFRDGLAVVASAGLAFASLVYAIAVAAGAWTWLIAPLLG